MLWVQIPSTPKVNLNAYVTWLITLFFKIKINNIIFKININTGGRVAYYIGLENQHA